MSHRGIDGGESSGTDGDINGQGRVTTRSCLLLPLSSSLILFISHLTAFTHYAFTTPSLLHSMDKWLHTHKPLQLLLTHTHTHTGHDAKRIKTLQKSEKGIDDRLINTYNSSQSHIHKHTLKQVWALRTLHARRHKWLPRQFPSQGSSDNLAPSR